MAGFNRVIMVGNLTKDPELKQLNSGQAVCRLTLASNRQFKNRQTGAMVQDVCFIDVEVWGPQAEACKNYLQKGRPVLVEGRIKFDTWKENDGQMRSKHSIVADRVIFMPGGSPGTGAELSSMEGFSEDNNVPRMSSSTSKASTKSGDNMIFKDEAPFEDDLPF